MAVLPDQSPDTEETMSFSAIRNTAYSSLMATQVKMQVTSSNIANADVAGYTRKSVKQVNTSNDGIGTGVAITDIVSAVSKFLVKDMAKALTAVGEAKTIEGYAAELQSLFGSISAGASGSGTSLANTLAQLESALNQLALTPESATLKAMAISALDAVAVQMRETSTGIQALRANADGQIATSVETINGALHTIDLLNTQIAQGKAMGQPVADLEDMRNSALQTISEQMDIHYYVSDTGQMRINTRGGTPLLDSRIHELSYEGKPVVSAGTVFNPITVDGKAVDGEINSGVIGALFDMRDTILPSVQDELDQLANSLIAALNSTYNGGTTKPAPSVLTGMTTVAPTDSFTRTGTLRVASLDSDGKIVSYADIDLTALPDPASVQDLVDEINASASGITASINSQGKLVLAAPAGQGVAITDLGSQIDGQGVSDYFGLNDLMVGTGAASIGVRKDLLASPGNFSNATLSKEVPLAAGDVGLSTSAPFLGDLAKLFGATQTFGAAGTLSAITTSFSDYAATIVSHVASTAHDAEKTLSNKQMGYDSLANAMASQTGVNIDEETGRLSELEQQYATAAQIFQVLNDMFEALLQAAKTA
jgi:flagellar hook-associated protein 1